MRKLTVSQIDELKKRRESGVTVPELVTIYGLAKGAIWHHVKDIKLGDAAKHRIQTRRGGSASRAQKNWEVASKEASSILENFDADSAWVPLIAALYWGERTKKSGFVFTNTDERMISVFMKIMREHFGVADGDFDVLIRTFTPMDPNKCKAYWSVAVGLPEENIRINHNDIQNKSKTAYGICRITLRGGGYRLKLINCLIEQIAVKMLASESPRSSMD